MDGVVPATARARTFLVLLSALALIRLAGQQGARLGIYLVPEVDLRVVLIGALLAFFLVPRTRGTKSIVFSRRAMLITLWIVSSASVAVWRSGALAPDARLPATIGRPSLDSREGATLGSMQFPSRRELNRIAGRRRNIALDIRGYLFAPRSGRYRFEASCDDRCRLRIGETSIEVGGRDSFELEEGSQEIELAYVQRGGPAALTLAWDRPGLIELLPIDHFVHGRPDAEEELARRRIGVFVSLVASGLLWVVGLCLVLRAGEERAWWRQALAARQWVLAAAGACVILYGAVLRVNAFLVHSRLVETEARAASFYELTRPWLPNYSLLNPASAPEDPYRADVRSYLDRAEALSPGRFYEGHFREPFYVLIVKTFVWLAGGREIGILVQSLVFSILVLPLLFYVSSRLFSVAWALARKCANLSWELKRLQTPWFDDV